MKPIADSEEIGREGGLVILVDILGTEWTLTLEEAKCFPFVRLIRPLELKDGFWTRDA